MPPQLWPPCNYTITAASEVLRMISLSTVGMTTTPAFAWQTTSENWFSPINTDLYTALGAANSVSLKAIHHSPTTPDATLVSYGNGLATTTANTFQQYAKATLTTTDWKAAPATYNAARSFYFVQPQVPVPVKLLIELDPTDNKKLAHLFWFSAANTVTSYMANVADGTAYTLNKTALTSVPTTGYYYRSPV